VINLTFQGLTNPVVGDGYVITGMTADWTILPTGSNCTNWTSSTAKLEIGLSGRTDANFLQETDHAPYPCDPTIISTLEYRVYCVEQ
jgi:hypothetical protein